MYAQHKWYTKNYTNIILNGFIRKLIYLSKYLKIRVKTSIKGVVIFGLSTSVHEWDDKIPHDFMLYACFRSVPLLCLQCEQRKAHLIEVIEESCNITDHGWI